MLTLPFHLLFCLILLGRRYLEMHSLLSVRWYFVTYLGFLWRVTILRIPGICNNRCLCLLCILFMCISLCVYTSPISYEEFLTMAMVEIHRYCWFLIRWAAVNLSFSNRNDHNSWTCIYDFYGIENFWTVILRGMRFLGYITLIIFSSVCQYAC